MSEGGVKRPLREILVVLETQMAPAVESWCCWAEDFPPWRESALT
jgi:hypothetical protein